MLIFGLLVVVALVVVIAVVAVARTRRAAPVSAPAQDEICMFCQKPVQIGDEGPAFLLPKARELLGTEPPERSLGTDHHGHRRALSHIECARAAQEMTCAFCRKGMLPGESVAGMKMSYVRQLLGTGERVFRQ